MIKFKQLRDLLSPDAKVCLVENLGKFYGTLQYISKDNDEKEVLHYSQSRTNEITIILSEH